MVQLILQKTFSNFFKRLPTTIMFGIGIWFLHTYLLVYVNNGFIPEAKTFLGNFLALKGTVISGTIIWMILSSILFGIISKASHSGPRVGLNERLGLVTNYFKESKYDAFSVLIAGAGISLTVGALLNGYANLAMAMGLGTLQHP